MARFDSVPPLRFDSGIKLDSEIGPVPAPTKKHMSEPALKLASLTRNETKILAGSMATGLTDNPALVPTPAVTPAQLTTAVTALSNQEVALANAESNVTTQRDLLDQKVSTLKALMTTSADDSTIAVGRDGVKMEQLNIPLKGAGTPAPVAGPPQNFSVTQGDHSGDVDGHCDRVAGAKLYKAEKAASPAGPWTAGYEGSKSKFTIAGLTPGQEMWFRMAAFAGGAWTDWSDPATCRVI